MFVQQIKEAFKKRAATDDEWDHGVQQCWDEEISLLTENMDDTIDFLDHECTDEDFSWTSEVFDKIVEKAPSRAFIAALRRTAARFPEETKKYNIMSFIDSAEAIVDNIEKEKKKQRSES